MELFPLIDDKQPLRASPQPSQTTTTASNDSFTSIFSGIAASSMAFASSLASTVKTIDQQYGVSETVISGASTAWSQSKKIASDIDTKYHVKESVASAVQTTKEGVISTAGTITEKISKNLSQPTTTSPTFLRQTPPPPPPAQSAAPSTSRMS